MATDHDIWLEEHTGRCRQWPTRLTPEKCKVYKQNNPDRCRDCEGVIMTEKDIVGKCAKCGNKGKLILGWCPDCHEKAKKQRGVQVSELPSAPPTTVVAPAPEPAPNPKSKRACIQCGGTNMHTKELCEACYSTKRNKARRENRHEGTEIRLLFDGPDLEILEKIKGQAKKERRSPSAQVMTIIERSFNSIQA